jgi:hypothetical protein
MAINVKIGPETDEGIKITIHSQEKDEKKITLELNARKTLDGDLVIRDHPDIDVVIMPKKMKLVAFPKESSTEETYNTQDKMFDFLIKRGVLIRDSLQGGNVFGSMEAKIVPTENKSSSKFVLLGIARWVETERPYFDYLEKFEQMQEDRFTEPSEEESTDFDPSRQAERKGVLRPMYIRSPYGLNFAYGYRE